MKRPRVQVTVVDIRMTIQDELPGPYGEDPSTLFVNQVRQEVEMMVMKAQSTPNGLYLRRGCDPENGIHKEAATKLSIILTRLFARVVNIEG